MLFELWYFMLELEFFLFKKIKGIPNKHAFLTGGSILRIIIWLNSVKFRNFT